MALFVGLFCLAITLHNIEEAIWLPKWSQQPSRMNKSVTASEFRFAVIVITGFAYIVAISYWMMPSSNLAKWGFIGFLGAMIVNTVFPHLVATFVMKKYAPGLLTGLFLNIPINSWVLYELMERDLINWKAIIFSTVVVGVCLLALIPLLFKAQKKFENRFQEGYK